MEHTERTRSYVILVICLLGIAYVATCIAEVRHDLNDAVVDPIKLGLLVIFCVVGFLAGRDYFRFTRTTPVYLTAMSFLILFHITDVTEEFAVFHEVPLLGPTTLAKRAFEMTLLAGSVCLFVGGSYLSVAQINKSRRQLQSNLNHLRESEAKYRNIFNTVADGIFVAGPDGRVDEVNDSACDQLGYARDELIGKPVSAVSSRPGFNFQTAWDRVQSQGTLSYETSHRRKDGSLVPVELRITRAEHKGMPAVLGVARDITERKRSENLTRIQRDLAVRLGSAGNLQEGLSSCLRAAIDASGLDCGGIYLRDEQSGDLDMPCHSGLSDDFVARISHYNREAANTRLVMEGRPLYASFEGLGVPPDETMVREGLQAIAVIPITHRNEVIGCLNVASHSLLDVPSYSRNILETIASQIGGTVARLKAEEKTRRDRELLDRITDTSPAGITVVDRDGRLRFANPAAQRILGLAGNQITQRAYDAPAWHITDHAGGPFPKEQLPFRQVMSTGRPVHDVHHAIEWPDGRRVLLSVNAAPLFDEAGRVEAVVATIDDVTKRVRAEQALRASEAQFRSIVESSPLGMHMYQLEPDGRLVFTGANPAADTILGVDNSRFIGKTIEEAFPPLTSTEAPERYRLAAREGRSWNTEQIDYEYGRIKGAFDVHAFQTAPGKAAVMFRDVTERKKAEQERLEYQRRLRSLASELSLAEERERRRIAADLHDQACQTLVLSKMRLQELRESMSSEDLDEVAGVCRALDQTIESVRELTFDLSSPTLYRFGLESALEELLEDKLAEHGIRCVFHNDEAPKPLAQDVRILLFQSVREILINAIKHAQAREVSLDVARSEDTIRITVADDGVGFDAKDILAGPSRNRGFGLFNIKERLDYIGGALDMESRPGRGSRFTLTARLQTEEDVAKEARDGHDDPAG